LKSDGEEGGLLFIIELPLQIFNECWGELFCSNVFYSCEESIELLV